MSESRIISENLGELFPEIVWKLSKNISNYFGKYLKLSHLKNCFRKIWENFQKYFWKFQEILTKFLKIILKFFF